MTWLTSSARYGYGLTVHAFSYYRSPDEFSFEKKKSSVVWSPDHASVARDHASTMRVGTVLR